jgi:serine protease AprX
MSTAIHDHLHAPNRFAVIPTAVRLNADPQYTGKGVTIAFLDSGFYPHPDLVEPRNRILCFKDITGERISLDTSDAAESWQWHGTQTTIVAAGTGHLCDGVYKGLANESQLVLVKVSRNGRITEENIARGLKWVLANRERFNICILNISLGGDDDVPCTRSIIDQAAEEAISNGIVVVAAAGNSSETRSIPPANSPSVITVGGYHDNNQLNATSLDLYHSNFGPTADGTVKPELVGPAMWVAAPILPGTNLYARAEALSLLAAAPDYQLPSLAHKLEDTAELPEDLLLSSPDGIRRYVEDVLRDLKIVSTHYQHVDGTSFAAPIVTSIVAQMLEANPALTPGAIKNILISTADRIAGTPAMRQGFGVVNARRAVELAKKEQHALSVVGCSPPRVQNGNLVFVYHDDEARTVSLAGDFNDWDTASNQLARDTTGLWSCRLAAPGPGRYEYKFIVNDQRWIEDPANGMRVSDGYGGLNSVIVIQ